MIDVYTSPTDECLDSLSQRVGLGESLLVTAVGGNWRAQFVFSHGGLALVGPHEGPVRAWAGMPEADSVLHSADKIVVIPFWSYDQLVTSLEILQDHLTFDLTPEWWVEKRQEVEVLSEKYAAEH